jgi:arylsulfatase A-like enzyme
VRTNYDPGGAVRALDDRSTIATWLQGAGYRTSFVGKYLNGYGSLDVNRDGVRDINDIRYVPPGWTDWQALFDPTTYRMYHFAINDNGAFAVHGGSPADYQTDALASRAARFIHASETADDAAPFMLVVMPTAPHVEVPTEFTLEQYSDVWRFTIRPAPRHAGTIGFGLPGPPSFNESDVSDKPGWLRDTRPALAEVDTAYVRHKYQARLGSLRAVDDMIGTIVAALTATGEMENTVLIFSSDNGYHLGEHRLGEKLDAYEESIRVPLYVAGPGVLRQSLAQMVANNDLAPAIADFAGVTPGLPVDGRSFKPLLSDGALAWRKRLLIEHWDAMDSTICLEFPASCAVLELPSYAAVRTVSAARYVPSQSYVEYADGSIEMYDLAIDPYQLSSLHADQSETRVFQRSVHAQWLAALKTCRNGTCQSYEFQ